MRNEKSLGGALFSINKKVPGRETFFLEKCGSEQGTESIVKPGAAATHPG